MSTHQTAFSQICRAIANKTRLQLLWNVFQNQELCVQDLAIQTGVSESNASNQLKALAAKELIIPHRGKQTVFYKPGKPSNTAYAKELLPVLRECHSRNLSFQTIIHQATAFTHERRIQIVQCLMVSEETFESLLKKTGMTIPSLNRHLRKLLQRHVIQKKNRTYQLMKPDENLARCLLKLATKPAR